MADLPYGELERLYALLAARNVDTGVLERVRLEWLLEQAGAPGEPFAFTAFVENRRDTLRRQMRALLAKSTELGRAVEEGFTAWVATLPRPAAPSPSRSSPAWHLELPQRGDAGRSWRRSLRVLAPLVVTMGLFAVLWPRTPEIGQEPEPEPEPEQGPVLDEPEPEQAPEPGPTTPESTPPCPWWLFGLGALGVGLAVGLLAAALARPRFPPPLPAPRVRGDARAGAETPPSRGLLILSRADQDALVWGIGKALSDSFTDRLDAERTVTATAERGGLLSLHFEQARAYRGVWLWIDRRSRVQRDALRLADEIESTLTSAGLPVHRAMFSGIPELLELEDGNRRTPAQLGARHRGARVVVLTDGAVLVAHHRNADQRSRVMACLADLADWESLAVGDLGSKAGFAELLQRFGLPRLAPQDIVAHLAGLRAVRRSGQGDLLAWEIACAVMMRRVSEDEALALRNTLRLDVMPWDLPMLRGRAPGPASSLQWTQSTRAAAFSRFSRGERYAEGLAQQSLLMHALAWWRWRCDEIEATSLRSDPHWRETLPGLRLAGERAMLDLWVEPDRAVGELFRLLEHDAQHIRGLVGGFVDADTPTGGRYVQLPWRLPDRPRAVRAMLRALGFAPAVRRPEGLARPGVLGPVAGVVGVGVALLTTWPEATVVTARSLAVALAAVTAVGAAAMWLTRSDRAFIWRFGHVPVNSIIAAALWSYAPGVPEPSLGPEPQGDATPTTGAAPEPEPEGPVPEVPLVIASPLPEPGMRTPPICPKGQILVEGKCKPKQPCPTCRTSTTPTDRGAPEVLGVVTPERAPVQPPEPIESEMSCPTGMAVIAGTDPGGFADGATGNKHEIKALCIDVTEVTVAAFARCVDGGSCTEPDADGHCNWGKPDRRDHPINCVDLEQARSHCRHLGKRLPTEWEWEWAARGGDEARRYPWGEESPSCARVVMGHNGCGKGRTWPVRSKSRGSSRDGLQDMSGNVWEWTSSVMVQRKHKLTNVSLDFPVARGGSWNDTDPAWFQVASRWMKARNLKSPEGGFRCVTEASSQAPVESRETREHP
ncbi:SUMF1/EgtB/PvdO family nonheme iron enzyme [Nannocystis sp. RBIL2]|uniref:SUMF1/EgtB/PvdO family nonheme iron enzyme n=1 Tax=Nannocystis sp. RBIL2 TaxID=2996788 RepID=UPI0022701F60|nr:SUMF1/EgtB/PvdO family nonheme iron enzyme [Nannocystis sp. RBIL2]MCY1066761.1 SUMF1/EgtB/PvdO family nonheme iron enzyme [Nannocystis sp. RBIL2]